GNAATRLPFRSRSVGATLARHVCDPGSPSAASVPLMSRNKAAVHRFELESPGGLAVADYRLSGDRMAFYCTEVPLPVRRRAPATSWPAARSTRYAPSI